MSHFTEKPIFKTVRPKRKKRNWQINEAAQYERRRRQSIFPGAVRERSAMQDYAEISRRLFSSCNIFLPECYSYKCMNVILSCNFIKNYYSMLIPSKDKE